MIDDDFTNGADRQGAIERRCGAFAGNITERESQPAFAVGKKIVEISAQGARGYIGRREIEPGNFAGAGGKELALDFARGIELAPKPPLAFPRVLIEPRILKCDGHVGA